MRVRVRGRIACRRPARKLCLNPTSRLWLGRARGYSRGPVLPTELPSGSRPPRKTNSRSARPRRQDLRGITGTRLGKFQVRRVVRAAAAQVALGLSCALFWAVAPAAPSFGQVSSRPMYEPAPQVPAGELLVMSAPNVVTWENEDPTSPTGTASVVQLGEVPANATQRGVNGVNGVNGSLVGDAGGLLTGQRATIRIDGTQLSARAAVVWINPAPNTVGDKQLIRAAVGSMLAVEGKLYGDRADVLSVLQSPGRHVALREDEFMRMVREAGKVDK